MNPRLTTALNLYKSNDIDIQNLIGWHLFYGVVISTPKVFALCFHSHSEEPEKAISFDHSDTLFVTMCCGDMLTGLRFLKDDYKYISFSRDFKGIGGTRLLDMETFYSKLQ